MTTKTKGRLMKALTRFLSGDEGVTSVEYAVMLALIVGMCIAAIAVAGGPVQAFWEDSSDSIGEVVNP